MKLYIDTSANDHILVSLLDEKGETVFSKKKAAFRKQSEYLLPLIESLLVTAKAKPQDLDGIEVNNRGGSFMSLRIGISVANALGFAWGIKVKPRFGRAVRKHGLTLAVPEYDRPPDIGKIK